MADVGASQAPRVPAYFAVDLPAYGHCQAGGRTALTVGSSSTRAVPVPLSMEPYI